MSIKDIIEAYQEEISNWDFYSDSQRAFLDKEGRIVVCLRNYDWYITKEPIKTPMEAVEALFEITWLSEFTDTYDDSHDIHIRLSKRWRIDR